jgi:hypothetical protein
MKGCSRSSQRFIGAIWAMKHVRLKIKLAIAAHFFFLFLDLLHNNILLVNAGVSGTSQLMLT